MAGMKPDNGRLFARSFRAWGPIALGASLAQTRRNAAPRHLTGDLGMIAATLLEFLYGLLFAVIWLTVAWVGFAERGAWPRSMQRFPSGPSSRP